MQKILHDSKRLQKIPKDSKDSKELISKRYFALREPARAQKANGSSPSPPPPEESKTMRRPHCLGA